MQVAGWVVEPRILFPFLTTVTEPQRDHTGGTDTINDLTTSLSFRQYALVTSAGGGYNTYHSINPSIPVPNPISQNPNRKQPFCPALHSVDTEDVTQYPFLPMVPTCQ